jgi:SIR2-like domain
MAGVADQDQSEPEATTNVPLVTPPGLALDPMVALATSVHASPGVYALLLGSGVSTGAGILTGWQVVTDLVRRGAAAQAPEDIDAASEAGDSPEAWWAGHGDGQPLGYSTLLGALAPTPAARQALLAGFFEPTDDDRDRDLKLPSRAHRAIAQLVVRGAVRVILTTNFDRLTERALEDAGVPPQVLHRPEQLSSATPLAHARVTVIKLHGDYADLEQRNTVDELAEYPQDLAAYVGRVLDEYGLIVSGWSAEWDTALVRTLEETRSRRYPLFWSSYGTIGTDARRLIAQHGAVSLGGQTADELFTGLANRLDALDRLATMPIATDIAVEQLKRAVPDPRRRVELFDLVDGQVQRLASQVKDRTRHPLGGMPLDEQRSAYEAESSPVARLLATGVFHGDTSQAPVWTRALQRLMSARDPFVGSHNAVSEAMRHYPALLCLWAMGVSAILAKHQQLLAMLLLEAKWIPIFGDRTPQSPVQCLNPARILFADDDKAPNDGRWIYPQSHHIRAASRDALSDLEPDDAAYEAACDRLEYLASLISVDEDRFPWQGEFLLERHRRIAVEVEKEIVAGWPLLAGDAFGGDLNRAKAAHHALDDWMGGQPSW